MGEESDGSLTATPILDVRSGESGSCIASSFGAMIASKVYLFRSWLLVTSLVGVRAGFLNRADK